MCKTKEKKMEQISELLQEAKPLYFERKRRRTQVKATLFSMAVVFTAFFSVMNFNSGSFVAFNESKVKVDSVIEDLYGLPVDDYGLFQID